MRSTPDKCEIVNRLGYIIALYLARDIDSRTIEFSNECFKAQKYNDYLLYKKIYFPIIGKLRGKKNLDMIQETVDLYFDLNKLNNLGSIENRNKLKKILSVLEKREDSISDLLKAQIYYDTGNNSRANRYLSNILIRPLHFNTFLLQGEKSRKSLDGLYKSVLTKIKLLSKNRTLLNAVVIKLIINGSEPLSDFLISEFGNLVDESSVENLSKSSVYGKPNVQSWINYYFHNEYPDSYIFQKVSDSNFFQNLSTSNSSGAWLLEYDLSIPKQNQNQIMSMIKNLGEKQDNYSKDLYLHILTNNKVKNIFTKFDNNNSRPLFIQKREFFKSLLDNSIATSYALYQLVKLGDDNLAYLDFLYEL